ncbi:MAG: hypothetical protein RIR97_1367 [Pseudomonadota bacterium]
MDKALESSHKVPRKTEKITILLQVYSMTMVLVLAILYGYNTGHYSVSKDIERDNRIWSAYQADRLAKTLSDRVSQLSAEDRQSSAVLNELSNAHAQLHTEIALLAKLGADDTLSTDVEAAALLTEIGTLTEATAPSFSASATENQQDSSDQRLLASRLDLLSGKTHDLLVRTRALITEARLAHADAKQSFDAIMSVYFLLVIVSTLFLMSTLYRQMANIRSAGVKMEQMTEKLTDACQAADDGNRAKSQFMATIGHEIRTPLNGILGMAELLELSDLAPDAKANVRTIRDSGESLLEILNEILDYSKIEHGKLELEYRTVDLRELVQSTADIMRARATEHGNKIVLDIPETLEAAVVRTDPTRLRQVILNLMSNAVKFTDRGTITLRVRETGYLADGLKANKADGSSMHLRIEVIDTGIGIDTTGLQKLFQPFSQVDATITRKYGGTGLGLTICKQIVERLGGEMGVESQQGRGSTFWFSIPVTPMQKKASAEVSCTGDGPSVLPPMSILLVEDNRVNQQVMIRFLDRLGQRPVVAENGQIAVSMAQEQDFDLILMDMQMPIMDGIEATRHIRRRPGRNAETSIIAMTANASDDDRQSCTAAGMNGFELKPVSLHRLHTLLVTTLDEKQTHHPKMVQADRSRSHQAENENIHSQSQNEKNIKSIKNQLYINDQRKNELIEVLGEADFNELLVSYYNELDGILDSIKSALRAGDKNLMDRSLHSLKGSAANVGFDLIAQHAEDLRHGPLSGPEKLSDLILLIETQKAGRAA